MAKNKKFNDLLSLIAKYFFSNMSLQFLNLISLFLIMSALTNELFGVYSYVVELLSIFALIAESGTRSFYIREISSSNEKEKTIKEINSIHYVLSIISFFMVCVISVFVKYNYTMLVIIGLGYALSSLFVPLQAYVVATELVRLTVIREQLIGITRCCYFLVGYFFNMPVEYYFIFIYFQVVVVLIFWLAVNEKMTFNLFARNKINRILCARLMKVIPFSLLIAVNLLYNKIDIYMLQSFSSFESVGIYSGAMKLVYPFMFLSSIFMMAVFPRLAKHKNLVDKGSFDYISELTIFSIKFLSILGIVLAVTLSFIGEVIYTYFWHGEYISSFPVFQVLVFYLPVVFSYGVITNAMVAKDKINVLLYVNIFALFLNVILNLHFIPMYGAKGAAFCTLLCEIFILNFGIYYAKSTLKIAISKKIIYILSLAQVGLLNYVWP